MNWKVKHLSVYPSLNSLTQYWEKITMQEVIWPDWILGLVKFAGRYRLVNINQSSSQVARKTNLVWSFGKLYFTCMGNRHLKLFMQGFMHLVKKYYITKVCLSVFCTDSGWMVLLHDRKACIECKLSICAYECIVSLNYCWKKESKPKNCKGTKLILRFYFS